MAAAEGRRWRRTAPPDYRVHSVEVLCELLDLLLDHPAGLSLDAIARSVSASKTTVYRYLVTMAMSGYVEAVEPEQLYRTGPKLLPPIATHIDVLIQRARPMLRELAAQFSQTATVGMLDATAVTILDVAEGPSALQVAHRQGERVPVHATALGKALTATLPGDTARRLLRLAGQPSRTPRTITDPDALIDQLRAIRRRGWALDDGEYETGVRAVAVALPGHRVVVGLAVSGPAERLADRDLPRIATVLGRVAEQIAGGRS